MAARPEPAVSAGHLGVRPACPDRAPLGGSADPAGASPGSGGLEAAGPAGAPGGLGGTARGCGVGACAQRLGCSWPGLKVVKHVQCCSPAAGLIGECLKGVPRVWIQALVRGARPWDKKQWAESEAQKFHLNVRSICFTVQAVVH